MYRLSTTLRGHDDDVKTLAALGTGVGGAIVSGSRDSTVRIWHRSSAEGKDFDSSVINFKANAFINSLAIYDYAGEVLIASAGNENIINLTSPKAVFTDASGSDEFCLLGHTANICTLDTYENYIISGSWDCTAKVWDKFTGEVLYDLKGHENSVWGAKFINSETFLTCGADRTIRKWVKGKQVKRFIAHDDVVRDIVILSNGDFASCSNDATIKIWDGESFECKAILTGHQSFIYSLAINSMGDIISCGEDRSVRVWRNNECLQVITLPSISVWKVIVLPNDDIVTASSDSLVRVFTRNSERYAKDNEMLVFKKDLEESSVSESSLGNVVNKNSLPGIEALNVKGEPHIEGETKLIRSNMNTIDIYAWNESQWVKIGQMVQGNSASSNRQKQLHEGKYYDYVFNIDVEEGAPPLKLPVNITENPYEIAEKFLATYNLPYSYLQQIVDFILTNAEGISLDGASVGSGGYSEPSKPGILPQRTYLTFEKVDATKLIGAFNKLNSKQGSSVQILDNVETLINCEDYNKIHTVAMEIIQNWEGDAKLLGFDILRGVITKIQPSEQLFPVISTGLSSDTLTPKIQMMTLRILINTFVAKGWGEQMMLDEDILDVVFTDSLWKNLDNDKTFFPITVATLILNYAVLVNKFQLLGFQEKLMRILSKMVQVSNIMENDEASYRVLIAIGTLNYMKTIVDKVELLAPFHGKEGRFAVVIEEIK